MRTVVVSTTRFTSYFYGDYRFKHITEVAIWSFKFVSSFSFSFLMRKREAKLAYWKGAFEHFVWSWQYKQQKDYWKLEHSTFQVKHYQSRSQRTKHAVFLNDHSKHSGQFTHIQYTVLTIRQTSVVFKGFCWWCESNLRTWKNKSLTCCYAPVQATS